MINRIEKALDIDLNGDGLIAGQPGQPYIYGQYGGTPYRSGPTIHLGPSPASRLHFSLADGRPHVSIVQHSGISSSTNSHFSGIHETGFTGGSMLDQIERNTRTDLNGDGLFGGLPFPR